MSNVKTSNNVVRLLIVVGFFNFVVSSLLYAVTLDGGAYILDTKNYFGKIVIEGSARAGGSQPDYLLDLTKGSELRKKIAQVKEEVLADKNFVTFNLWQDLAGALQNSNLEIISNLIKKTFPRRTYECSVRSNINLNYQRLGVSAPFEEYIINNTGCCREYSILSHLVFNELEIPSVWVYTKTIINNVDFHDHGFNLVAVNSDSKSFHLIFFDPYFKKLNFKLVDEVIKYSKFKLRGYPKVELEDEKLENSVAFFSNGQKLERYIKSIAHWVCPLIFKQQEDIDWISRFKLAVASSAMFR